MRLQIGRSIQYAQPKGENLRLQSSTGPETGGSKSKKSNERELIIRLPLCFGVSLGVLTEETSLGFNPISDKRSSVTATYAGSRPRFLLHPIISVLATSRGCSSNASTRSRN